MGRGAPRGTIALSKIQPSMVESIVSEIAASSSAVRLRGVTKTYDSGRRTLSRTLAHGISVGSWNTKPIR
jgi:hypothetical protein